MRDCPVDAGLQEREAILTMNVGFTYNAIVNTFGFTFELIPNIAAANMHPGTGGYSSGGFH